MTRTKRQPYHWLTLGIGLIAALTWTSLGLRAIVPGNDPSSRALLVCAALVLAGFALGSVAWILAAPRRAKRPADVLAEMKAPQALLGIMAIGVGADSILDPSPSAWGWTLLVAASLVGGLNLGGVFMAFAQQAAPATLTRQSTGAPQSDG